MRWYCVELLALPRVRPALDKSSDLPGLLPRSLRYAVSREKLMLLRRNIMLNDKQLPLRSAANWQLDHVC